MWCECMFNILTFLSQRLSSGYLIASVHLLKTKIRYRLSRFNVVKIEKWLFEVNVKICKDSVRLI